MRLFTLAFLLVSLLFTQSPTSACTGVYVTDGNVVLAGNNEDFWNYDTKLWFVPPEEDKLGCIFFGHDFIYSQGGMNEKGLFFDGFATAPNPLKKAKGKKIFPGNIMDEIMRTCETVPEALEILEQYNLSFLETAMFMLGDRHGNSVIYEGDDYILNEGGNQVLTNFYQSRGKSEKLLCGRFQIATSILENSTDLSVDLVRGILSAVHVEATSLTQYSYICDLKKGLVYVYHFHNFENVVIFDLAEELKKGAAAYDIPSLFPKNFAFEMYRHSRDREMREEVEKRLDKDFDISLYSDYTGEYGTRKEALGDSSCKVTLDGERLLVEYSGEEAMELFPEKRDRFFHVSIYGTLEFMFTRNEDGAVESLVREHLGRRFEFFKLP